MNLEDLEKQLQEIQKIDPSTLTPKQLQELIDKLSFITDMEDEVLSIQEQEIEGEELDYDNYLSDINNNENESYDETDNP